MYLTQDGPFFKELFYRVEEKIGLGTYRLNFFFIFLYFSIFFFFFKNTGLHTVQPAIIVGELSFSFLSSLLLRTVTCLTIQWFTYLPTYLPPYLPIYPISLPSTKIKMPHPYSILFITIREMTINHI